jgi:superfamily II DNA helicase RecQ
LLARLTRILACADVLREVFGYPSFRAGQLQVVEHILAGRSCMAILPTGQGKSLCYQARFANCVHPAAGN